MKILWNRENIVVVISLVMQFMIDKITHGVLKSLIN